MTNHDELRRFAAVIEARLGLQLGDRLTLVAEVIARRALARREPSELYLARVEADDREEMRALASEVSVGETYFFRHVEQFHAYADVVASRRETRVLSAGCSSGEEPYTLAILAKERAPDPRAVTLGAFDVNPLALDRARSARYSRWALRATPAEQELRWFRADGREHVIADEIRRAVAFSEANLLEDGAWTSPPWDVIFCRNVTMYFHPACARAVIDRLVRALAPGGYLFLGHAETLRDRDGELELCHTHGTFYYRKIGHGSRRATTSVPHAHEPALSADDTAWVGEIAAASRRVHAMVDGALAPAAPVIASPSPASLLEPVRAMLAEERFAEALAALAALPPVVARGGDALLLRAVAQTQIGDVAGAKATCGELLAIDPRDANAHYLLAVCHGGAGDSASSERHAGQAIALDPSFAMASVQLAFLAKRAGRRAHAAEHLARALGLLEREDPARLALFAGGFTRGALVELCRAELAVVGSER